LLHGDRDRRAQSRHRAVHRPQSAGCENRRADETGDARRRPRAGSAGLRSGALARARDAQGRPRGRRTRRRRPRSSGKADELGRIGREIPRLLRARAGDSRARRNTEGREAAGKEKVESRSAQVGAFVRELDLAHVPPEVRQKAKLVFLDALGIALASSTMDFGLIALDAARALGGKSESRLIGTRDKVAAANAVLAGGTLAHGLDYDDTREGAIVHTGSTAAITALAVGEATGAGGKATLEAAIAGTEVMCKIGLAAPG